MPNQDSVPLGALSGNFGRTKCLRSYRFIDRCGAFRASGLRGLTQSHMPNMWASMSTLQSHMPSNLCLQVSRSKRLFEIKKNATTKVYVLLVGTPRFGHKSDRSKMHLYTPTSEFHRNGRGEGGKGDLPQMEGGHM